MPLLKAYHRIFWRGVRLPSGQLKFANPDFVLCLTILVVVFAWIAQIIFWCRGGLVVTGECARLGNIISEEVNYG